ncbi:MAG: hypothetical protein HGGPFJEG_02236 [Ignavibacteria bacterium]|nr:hypothetical protein [Ignavibacteria bacterium]
MVSILIPTLNRSSYLSQCLQSILNQTYKDFEIIVIDDGSEDDTLLRVKSLKNDKIIYKNAGRINNISKLRNEGIKISSGEFIAFCDDDDLWEPDKLEIQLEYLKKYRVVCSNAYLIDKDNCIIKNNYFNINEDLLLSTDILVRTNYMLTPSVIMDKKLLLKNMFDEKNFTLLNEDYSLWLKISENVDILFINRNLVRIREHGSITRKFENKVKIQEMKIKLFNKYLVYADDKIKDSAIRATLDSYIYMIKLYFKEKKIIGMVENQIKLFILLLNKNFSKEFCNIVKEKFRGNMKM